MVNGCPLSLQKDSNVVLEVDLSAKVEDDVGKMTAVIVIEIVIVTAVVVTEDMTVVIEIEVDHDLEAVAGIVGVETPSLPCASSTHVTNTVLPFVPNGRYELKTFRHVSHGKI